MKTITFLTDFGLKDGYVAQMKGVVLGITDVRIIDITHEISSHNIREGAFILRSVVSYYPIGSVHVVVVDPGVGTDRKGIFITTKNSILVGPDNGVLIPAAHFLGDFTVYKIKVSSYLPKNISSTFHGRDVFAPIAAHITNGISFDEIGDKTDDYVNLDFINCEIKGDTVNCNVIYVDKFGNVILNIDSKKIYNVLKKFEKVIVYCGKKSYEIPFVRSYGFVKKGEFLLTIGSGNNLEIAVNQGNAAKKLSLKDGDKVKLVFI